MLQTLADLGHLLWARERATMARLRGDAGNMDRFVMRFLLVCSLVVAAPLEPSTRTWSLLSGHHALAQSTAPAAGGPDQMAPSDAADDDADPTATDTVQGAIASGVTGTGAWLDSFFGTAHDQAENNKSRVRVSFVGGAVS